MASQQIEIILSRQMADSLSIPVFIVDTKGNLLFYNEPALGSSNFPHEPEWTSGFRPLAFGRFVSMNTNVFQFGIPAARGQGLAASGK